MKFGDKDSTHSTLSNAGTKHLVYPLKSCSSGMCRKGYTASMKLPSPSSVLITGASSGIGAALAEAYARPDCVLFLGGRNEERLGHVAGECRKRGATTHTRVIDVTDFQAMQQWVVACDDERPLDLVIANAGISSGAADKASDEAAARNIVTTNVIGVLNTVAPVIPLMQARQQGQIAIMSSLAGLRGLPSAPVYSASKVAVRAYGEALRGQLATDGIGVSVIMPGFVESRITDQNPFPMPLIMPAERAARIIKRGLEHGRARIAFPFPLYAMMWVFAALPRMIADVLLTRLPRKG